MIDEIEKTVKALATKAANASNGVEAQQFTQAVLNLVNARSGLKAEERISKVK